MNKRLLTIALAITVFTLTLLPAVSNAGKGRMGGQGLNNRTKSARQLRDRQRLRDGSRLNAGKSGAGAAQKEGMRHGPGDGTGNQANCPRVRTEKGSPAGQD
ncbi:MAG TPA: hypothetical protein VJ373_00840 [Desulfatiglandales bacterium]|nr:hypothetical protein [Desulfatiglandales bacterium]